MDVHLHRVNTPTRLAFIDSLGHDFAVEADLSLVNGHHFVAHPPFVMHKVRNGEGVAWRDYFKTIESCKHLKSLCLGLKHTEIDKAVLQKIIDQTKEQGINLRLASTSLSYLRDLWASFGPSVRLQYLLWILPVFELFQVRHFVNLNELHSVVDEVATWLPNNGNEAQKLTELFLDHKLQYFPGGLNTMDQIKKLEELARKRPNISGAYVNDLHLIPGQSKLELQA